MSKPIHSLARQIEAGKDRLVSLAHGLPVSTDELFTFFHDDIAGFGTPGLVTDHGIKQAVEWFVFRHLERREEYPAEVTKGMVQCTACTQEQCKYNVNHYMRQHSPQWRWCSDYTGRVKVGQ